MGNAPRTHCARAGRRCAYLVADEPLTGLDPAQRAIMNGLLEGLMKRLTLIVAVLTPKICRAA